MLVLTRKVGQRVIVDSNIVVSVLSVNEGQIRLGFDAPKEKIIHREEVYKRLSNKAVLSRFKASNINQFQKSMIN